MTTERLNILTAALNDYRQAIEAEVQLGEDPAHTEAARLAVIAAATPPEPEPVEPKLTPEQEYWQTVESLADIIIEEARKGDLSDVHDRLHELCDGNHYVIYTSAALDVLRWSSNDEAGPDEFGWEDLVGGCSSASELYSRLAFHALRQDVIDDLDGRDDFDLNDEDTWVIEVWSDSEYIEGTDEDGEPFDGDLDIRVWSDGRVEVEWDGDEDVSKGFELALASDWHDDKPEPVREAIHRILRARKAEVEK